MSVSKKYLRTAAEKDSRESPDSQGCSLSYEELLRGIARDLEYWRNVEPPHPKRIGRPRHVIAWRKSDARGLGMVRLDLPAWLGRRPTPRESGRLPKVLRDLHHRWLIERICLNGGQRTTHVSLTPEGARLAASMAADVNDGDNLPSGTAKAQALPQRPP